MDGHGELGQVEIASPTGQYQSERYDSSTRLAPYALWNAAAGYHVLPQLRIGGRIDNLFDKDYALASGYATPRRSYYVDFSYQL